ncbi:MAG: RDD family protein [Proteobacteria bacterium]|nr:RDD family protein [Pseudomonadota bacterium]MBU2228426.1 RDD family protein [Pseudomonadota bacterium]MBU2261868.1 RDD family protein [Pseudomonadota bacterium]
MADKRFGGFWRRLFAYLIDKFILYLICLILFLVGLLVMELDVGAIDYFLSSGLLPNGTGSFTLTYIVAMLLMDMAYFTWFHGAAGRTPGKMLFGLRVIQTSGDPLTFGVAFLRWVGYLISGPLFFLGFLWIAFDGRKQGWHDKIAATLVVRTGYEADGGVPAPASKTGRAELIPAANSSGSPPILPGRDHAPLPQQHAGGGR